MGCVMHKELQKQKRMSSVASIFWCFIENPPVLFNIRYLKIYRRRYDMEERNLLTQFRIQIVFFFLWWMIAWARFGEFSLAFLYILFILTFAVINGIVGTKRSFLYTAAPIVYIAFTSFIVPMLVKLDWSSIQAIYDGVLGRILFFIMIGPSIGLHNALSIGVCGQDFLKPVTAPQFLIFVVLQIGAFGLGYLWKLYSGKRKRRVLL